MPNTCCCLVTKSGEHFRQWKQQIQRLRGGNELGLKVVKGGRVAGVEGAGSGVWVQRTLGTQKQKEKTIQLKDEGLRQFFPGSANNKESTYQCRRHMRCRFNP